MRHFVWGIKVTRVYRKGPIKPQGASLFFGVLEGDIIEKGLTYNVRILLLIIRVSW